MDNNNNNNNNNPLLLDFTFPPYDIIQPNHIVPGIQSLLKQLVVELVELENKVEPTWPKLVVPLEGITDRLRVVWGVVDHLLCVKDSPEFRAAVEQVQPEKVEFQLRLSQSKTIYNAFKAIHESSDWDSLSTARKRVVEGQLKTAILGGVSLQDIERERFNEIQQELEKLALKFEGNILDAVKSYKKLISDRKYVEGLPVTTLALAARAATTKGYKNATAENGPWLITLNPPIYRSVMQDSQERSLREELYRAYVSRASSGDFNNTPIIEQILKLRSEKAKLLGFSNYAELSMETKMATVDQAKKLIESLRISAWDAAVHEMEDLKKFAKAKGAEEAADLNLWDLNFWSERIRESSYDIKEEELRPYLSLPKVTDGLFSLAKMLFDVDIHPADGQAPVWNCDVKFYCVKDPTGCPIAYFYLDPYSRPSEKRGGAWVSLVSGRSRALSRDGKSSRLPIVNVVCNQTPPLGNKPSLMTFGEVEAIFHEFGHALQIMLTKEDEGFVSGSQGIEWDAVELPSSFMENWCYQRNILTGIAKHYETEEDLPEEVCTKLLSAKTFRAGSLMLRQIRYAAVDLELHSEFVPGGSETIYDVDQRISRRTNIIPLLDEDKFLCSFSHIFADSYAAGYYSYQWAEVMSYDAFSAFEEAGLGDLIALKRMGLRFRDTVLALGGGKSPQEVFMEFRGREPSPEAFLRYLGLSPAVVAGC
ncbi:probable cytosolic oligopeptidase A isoform X2 [Spinacia oleracea]|uniref:oligopeptidase A n=1 Tax=Spinacia oleracea TaxID=3562 RepID=A0ABM3RU44_SPIOL|nr:probable cytosolic oligopeptidase A isoform X2 [Spinacia oleracea]